MNLSKFLKTTEGRILAVALVALAVYLVWRDEIDALLVERGVVEPKAVNPASNVAPAQTPGERVTNEVTKLDTSPKIQLGATGPNIRYVEERLREIGHNIPADNTWSVRDEGALVSFSGRRTMTVAEFTALYKAWKAKQPKVPAASITTAGPTPGTGVVGPTMRAVAPAGTRLRYQTAGVGSSRFVRGDRVRTLDRSSSSRTAPMA